MSYEDRPATSEHTEAALLFEHVASLLDCIDPTNYSGTFELPLSSKAITTLHADTALDIQRIIPARLAHKALEVRIGRVAAEDKLGVVGIALPIIPKKDFSITALAYDRTARGDYFIPFARKLDGSQEELDNAPTVGEPFIRMLLSAAQHPLPDFSVTPSDLKFHVLPDFIKEATTYTLHRQDEFAVDMVHEIRVEDTINRYYEDLQAHRPGFGRQSPRSKRRAARSKAGTPFTGYIHEQTLDVTVTEFAGFEVPARPVNTLSLSFHAQNYEIDAVRVRLQVEPDQDSERYTLDVENPNPSLLITLHDILAEYEIGGVRRPKQH